MLRDLCGGNRCEMSSLDSICISRSHTRLVVGPSVTSITLMARWIPINYISIGATGRRFHFGHEPGLKMNSVHNYINPLEARSVVQCHYLQKSTTIR